MFIPNHISIRLLGLMMAASHVASAITEHRRSFGSDVTRKNENQTPSSENVQDVNLNNQGYRSSDTDNMKEQSKGLIATPPRKKRRTLGTRIKDIQKRQSSGGGGQEGSNTGNNNNDNNDDEMDIDDDEDEDEDEEDEELDITDYGQLVSYNSYPDWVDIDQLTPQQIGSNFALCFATEPDILAACGACECSLSVLWGCTRDGLVDLGRWVARHDPTGGTNAPPLPQHNPRLAHVLPPRTVDNKDAPEEFCKVFGRCYCLTADSLLRGQMVIAQGRAAVQRAMEGVPLPPRFLVQQYTLGADTTSLGVQYFPFWEKRHPIPGMKSKAELGSSLEANLKKTGPDWKDPREAEDVKNVKEVCLAWSK